MGVEEFLSTMDALRFDTDLDETNPELRGMVTKVYPYLRKIYNMMYESGLISESKVNESKLQKFYVVDDGEVYNVLTDEDLVNYGVEKDQIVKVFTNMDMAFNYAENLNRKTEESNPDFSPAKGYYNESKVNEVHGVKKHNAPKDKRAAERKGNRDAEKDMFGDGFKSKNKIHKIKNYNRRDNKKVSIEDNDMNESKNIVRLSESELKNMVQESVKRIVKESYMDIPDANKTFDSDNDYITVSVPSDKFGELKHQIGVKMKELGYVYQDVGQNGNKAMITYRRIGI